MVWHIMLVGADRVVSKAMDQWVMHLGFHLRKTVDFYLKSHASA